MSDSWTLLDTMPFERSIMGGGKVGNYVYLMGGYTNDRDRSTFVSEVWRGYLPIITGITKTEADYFSVFPNPTRVLLNIETANPEPHSIEIHSFNGQLLYRTKSDGPPFK